MGIGTRLGNGCTSGYGVCGLLWLLPQHLAGNGDGFGIFLPGVGMLELASLKGDDWNAG
nr:hypothetical protein [Halomicronema hongdechloris]